MDGLGGQDSGIAAFYSSGPPPLPNLLCVALLSIKRHLTYLVIPEQSRGERVVTEGQECGRDRCLCGILLLGESFRCSVDGFR
jgi:hypothetical protein